MHDPESNRAGTNQEKDNSVLKLTNVVLRIVRFDEAVIHHLFGSEYRLGDRDEGVDGGSQKKSQKPPMIPVPNTVINYITVMIKALDAAPTNPAVDR